MSEYFCKYFDLLFAILISTYMIVCIFVRFFSTHFDTHHLCVYESQKPVLENKKVFYLGNFIFNFNKLNLEFSLMYYLTIK